jgi:hypothetical protein
MIKIPLQAKKSKQTSRDFFNHFAIVFFVIISSHDEL